MARLGVLGGTFDPIHEAHLAVARAAKEQLLLDAVLFIPAGDPWRKAERRVTAARHRLAMVREALAAADEPAFAVSAMEISREGPTYTEETLRALRERGHDERWFILGADALNDLPHWHDPAALIDLARLAVAPRPDSPIDLAELDRRVPGLAAAVDLLEMPPIDLRASALRGARARDGSRPPGIPPAVWAYIEAQGLYLP